MANTTRANLRTKTRRAIKIDPNGKIWGDDEVNDAINKAIDHVTIDVKPAESETSSTLTTTSWTQEQSLPSDFFRLTEVLETTVELKQIERSERTSGSGKPNKYYLYGWNIGWDTSPDSAYSYTLLYQKELTKLTDDADESPLPDSYDEAIATKAAYILHSRLRDNERGARWMKDRYEDELKLLGGLKTYNSSNMKYKVKRR